MQLFRLHSCTGRMDSLTWTHRLHTVVVPSLEVLGPPAYSLGCTQVSPHLLTCTAACTYPFGFTCLHFSLSPAADLSHTMDSAGVHRSYPLHWIPASLTAALRTAGSASAHCLGSHSGCTLGSPTSHTWTLSSTALPHLAASLQFTALHCTADFPLSRWILSLTGLHSTWSQFPLSALGCTPLWIWDALHWD